MNENFENLSNSSSYACRASDETISETKVTGSDYVLDNNNKKQLSESETDLDGGRTQSSSYLHLSGYSSNFFTQGSMSYLSVDGTNMLSDIASGGEFDDEINNTKYDDITNAGVNCFFCLRDGNNTEATHMCQSCQPGGRFICHRCLQHHNKFCEEHDVISLSVINEQETEIINHPIEKTNSEKGSTGSNDNRLVTPKRSNKNLGQTYHVDQEGYHEKSFHGSPNHKCLETVLMDPAEVCTNKKEIAITEERCSYKNKRNSPLPFFKDKRLLKIACDQRGLPQESKKISKYGSYNIKTSSDLKRCFITSMSQLDHTHLLLADSENKSLKLIQADTFQLVLSKRLEGHPNWVCALDDSLAAVLINSREISILSIGTKEIEQITSFKTDKDVNSITKDTGGLYVCFCDKIVFYNYIGEVDRSRFSIPSEKSKTTFNFRHIAGSSDQKCIYVSDLNHGILQFDRCGVLLWTLSGLRINTPTAMCIDQYDTIYVTDTDNSAFQIIRNNDTKSFKIEPIRDIEQASSLCFEKIHSRLVVGQWCSDSIQVFSVL